MSRLLWCVFWWCLGLSTAQAGWVSLDQGQTTTTYVSASSVKPSGDEFFRAWMLEDRKNVAADGQLSYVYLVEADCVKQRIRVVEMHGFEKSMGRGASSPLPVQGGWRSPVPQSVRKAQLDYVCKKAKKNPS